MFCRINKDTRKVIEIGYTTSLAPNSEFLEDEEGLYKWNDSNPMTEQLFKGSLKKDFIANINENNELINFIEIDKDIDSTTLRQDKIKEINSICANIITSGFHSSAYQGIDKLYGTTLEDQQNISANAMAAISKIAGVPECQNDKFYYKAQGEDFLEYTSNEILQLARDMKAFIESQQFKNKKIQEYIMSDSITIDKLEAVSWDMEIS